jgi:hypothetical protein
MQTRINWIIITMNFWLSSFVFRLKIFHSYGDVTIVCESEGPPHLVATYDTQGDAENLYQHGSSRVPFSHLFDTQANAEDLFKPGPWRV